MSLPVIVLAGGLAMRLRPLTERIPKSLVEIGGRPFAEHQIELLRSHGLTDIFFLTGHLGEQVPSRLGDGSKWGVRLRFADEGPVPMGTGGAIRAALPALPEEFFVLYGDSYLPCPYGVIEAAFRASTADALMTVCLNEDRWDTSNVRFEDGRVLAYDKQRRTPHMRHIDYGLGVFRREVFARWPAGPPLDLVTVYQRLLAEHRLAGFEVAGRFYEIGSPSGLEETRAYLAARGTLSGDHNG